MKSNIEVLNPLDYKDWDDLVIPNEESTIFHSSNWARVIVESYHYTPHYFTVIANKTLLGLIPVMEIKSILTGKRGVSLPFSDYCEPLFSENVSITEMLDALIKYGKQANWNFAELRSSKFDIGISPPSTYYFDHILRLNKNLDKIFASFRSDTRGRIKKAIKKEVKVNFNNSLEAMNEFYRLHCLTRKKHGLPPQPIYFFNNIFEHILLKNQGNIVLASYGKNIVAAGIFLHFGKNVIYKYGASNDIFNSVNAPRLLLWEAIQHYADQGYETFGLGRTALDNKGLREFKESWGTEEKNIKYFKIFLKKDTSALQDFQKHIFRNMPVPMLKFLGTLLYKHIG